MQTLSRKQLIENNIGLVRYIANKYKNANVELDDLVSVGYVGLVKAAKSFKENKGFKFSTFAGTCITNEILMYLRKVKRYNQPLYLDAVISSDLDGGELTFADTLGTEIDDLHNGVEQLIEIQKIKSIINELPTVERLIINRYIGSLNGNRMRQGQLAEFLGMSQGYVSRIEKKVLNKIRLELREVEQNAKTHT